MLQLERLYRDARITRIHQGTDEIQRLIIAREILDWDRHNLPRATIDGDGGDGEDGEDGLPDTLFDIPPAAPRDFELSFSQVKQFNFTWTAALGAQHYQLLERLDAQAEYQPVGAAVSTTSTSLTAPLFRRMHASYRVRACNVSGCTDSTSVEVVGSLAEAVGYVKASNTDASDQFGVSVALSEDESTLAVGASGESSSASGESSSATGIDGDQADNPSVRAGAVYVFARDEHGGRGASESDAATGIGVEPAGVLATQAGAVYLH